MQDSDDYCRRIRRDEIEGQMACEHWWNTVEELGYGYLSVCENCGKRESAEHSQECFDRMFGDKLPCNCGAAEEFEKYELGGHPRGQKS